LTQAFDYPNALVVCQRGPIACVANAEKYDLMDLEKGERIPLFPIMQNVEISEDTPSTEPTLPPLMVSVGKEDFLVTTGTTINDPAIGLFVDLNGDPVRGTLMFSSYPRAMSTTSSMQN
jgi:vacuolar protein sorting-associated protein 3